MEKQKPQITEATRGHAPNQLKSRVRIFTLTVKQAVAWWALVLGRCA